MLSFKEVIRLFRQDIAFLQLKRDIQFVAKDVMIDIENELPDGVQTFKRAKVRADLLLMKFMESYPEVNEARLYEHIPVLIDIKKMADLAETGGEVVAAAIIIMKRTERDWDD